MITVAPSILAADFTKLREEIESIADAGGDWVHVDVMDGQFVPALSFGTPIIKAARSVTNLPLDVHLMVYEPDHLIPDFIAAGSSRITVHVEAIKHLNRTIQLVKSLGARAGVTLSPGTSAACLEAVIDEVDLVLVMTVDPGFGGQKLIPGTLKKVERIAEMIKQTGKQIYLEVDGGITPENAHTFIEAGADVLVTGTAFFKAQNRNQVIAQLKQISR
ncbi:ribulose-phosphate 3-epimerase [candidate division KSB1 bacterium]|nr:ribulose-phosphate 3-epimerase [candidate division KSB1 bacterium]